MISDYNAYLEDGYYFDPIQTQKLRYEHADQRIEDLEIFAKPRRDQGLEVTVTTSWGSPLYNEIVTRIRDTKPSLIIKSTRHNRNISRFLKALYCHIHLLLFKLITMVPLFSCTSTMVSHSARENLNLIPVRPIRHRV